ncbi:hypothetical protein [Mariniblastus fucicola]|uniref:PEP-CTERM protein-sorting domain-containing protein n=1 Tax=Mariniblastus fucicola TaxID=980251 RepID=A0A5B9PF46_9BACT|nr:hypothetical protein [Mariniblastus fucicola]QEG23800.1 hypothetical protein MFFC18_37040 [Mariniblastus fucicola]
MTKFLVAILILFAASSAHVSAEIIALQSDRLAFNYRVDDLADANSGNVDLSYRGRDYGVSEAWFLSVDGTTTELTGGSVADGADVAADEKVWTVVHNDLSFQINFFAYDESEFGPYRGASLAMNVSLFNNSSTRTVSGALTNYGDNSIETLDNGSLVASTDIPDTSLFTSQEDAIGLATYTSKRWNASTLVGGTSVGTPASGWAMGPISDGLLASIRSGNSLGTSPGQDIFGTDVTGAAQWEFNLAPGTGIEIQSDLSVFVRNVPEPGGLAILAMFGMLTSCRRRK